MGWLWNMVRALTMSKEDYVAAMIEDDLREKYENDEDFRETVDTKFGDNFGKVEYNDKGEIKCEYSDRGGGGRYSGVFSNGNCKDLGTIEAYDSFGEPIVVCSNCYSDIQDVSEIWEKSYSKRKINPDGPPRLKY